MDDLPGVDLDARLAGLDTSEKREQHLFQWLSSVERMLAKTDFGRLKVTFLPSVEKILVRILNMTVCASAPRPSKPVRDTVARIYAIIFEKGDARSLPDALAAIQNILSQKKHDELAVKLAAIYVLGYLTERFGSKVSYMFGETCSLYLKHLKGARDSEIALRHEILSAFSACLKGVGKSVIEATWKDLLKYGKLGLTDKAAIIRVDAANLLENLFKYTPIPRLVKSEEFDTLILLSMKGFDSTNYAARNAISKFVGVILASSQQKADAPPADAKTGKSAKPVAKPATATAATASNIEDEGVLSVEEMLNLLQTNFIKASSKDARMGLVQCYSSLFAQLGRAFVESNYARIVKHLTTLVGQPKFTGNETDGIYHRSMCSYILRDVLGKMLSESGQLMALRELESGWLKKWSALFGPEAPSSKWVLTFILEEISSLLLDLGSASSVLAESLSDSLFNLSSFPSLMVNASLSLCMKIFAANNNKVLTHFVDRLLDLLQKNAHSLTGDKQDVLDRFTGYSNALASILATVRDHPIHASFETLAVVFGVALQLLKTAATCKDARVVTAQTQIAWTLLAGVCTLGPRFMSVHMSQLLLLWKAIFPKTLPKEVADVEAALVLSLVTREAALGSLHAFLKFNGNLVSIDIAKRVVVLLNNALSASTSVRALNAVSGVPTTPGQKRIQELELSVRKRIFDCFLIVKPSSTFDTSYVLLLKSAASLFSPDHEQYTGPVDKSTAALDLSVLTSLVFKEIEACGNKENRSGLTILTLRDFDVAKLEQLVSLITIFTDARVLGSLEYDPLLLLLDDIVPGTQSTLPLVTPIASVDSSIQLFSLLFPMQQSIHQEGALDQFSKCLKYAGNKVSAGRKLAVQINILVALLLTLKSVANKNGNLASDKVSSGIRDIALDALTLSNSLLKALASEIMGLLARVVTSGPFINQLVQLLVDRIVNNREPDSRAGCSLALGCIHVNAGSMAMGPHLKTSIGILHSLISDAHPLVHTWALYSLWLTIESSSLNFGPFVNATLALVIKLAMTDSHDSSFNASSNFMENNSAVFPLFGRILHALTGVLGPELADSSRLRELCFSLFEQLKHDKDPYVVVEAIRCIQQFIMFAPKHVDMPTLIPFLQEQISSRVNVHLIKTSAITCLYQLTQRDSGMVLDAATNMQLEEQCFSLLDTEADEHVHAELKDILRNLLKHVALKNPSRWIDLCKNILARGGSSTTGKERSVSSAVQQDDDDEGAGMGEKTETPKPSIDGGKVQEAVVLIPRWRTQSFCISCMRNLILLILESGQGEHIDLALARAEQVAAPEDSDLLIFRIADLIAISFNSATMPVKDLQIQGLYLLQDVILKFASVPDPDFEGHALLEQYQAQITAALTPAFSPDSTSELMSLATVVAGTYIGSGIIKEFHPSDRVLRLLGGALDSCKAGDAFLPSISTNEKEMLRLAVLTSWATLQLSSLKFQGSNRIIKDRVDLLAKLWVASINSAAEQIVDLDLLLRFKQRQSDGGDVKNELYVAATRDVLAASYIRCRVTIMQALCTLLQNRELLLNHVFDESLENLKSFVIVMLGLNLESISGFGLSKKIIQDHSGTEMKIKSKMDQENLDIELLCLGQMIASKIIPWAFFKQVRFNRDSDSF
ncbi:armadillo-type protein [Chytriomyces sp. MP71]|nr:armadillo-type protein [Chytriomyces sp. MP71]